MLKNPHSQNLKDISKKHRILILDTSVLDQYFPPEGKKPIIHLSLEEFFIPGIEKYPLYLTKNVKGEVLDGINKIINQNRNQGKVQKKYLTIKRVHNDLITQLEKDHRIINLDSNGLKYTILYRTYLEFMKGLSKTDQDILISSFFLNNLGFKTAILSNDFGILSAIEGCTKYEKKKSKDFIYPNFFVRMGKNSFKQMYIC
jgi:hypothetical protein